MKARIPSRVFLNPLFGTSQQTQANVAFSRKLWTCRRCLQQRQQHAVQIPSRARRANFASVSQGALGEKRDQGQGQQRQSESNRKDRSKRRLKYAAAGGTLAAATFAFSDDVKHAYSAVERTGRVVSALAVCINE